MRFNNIQHHSDRHRVTIVVWTRNAVFSVITKLERSRSLYDGACEYTIERTTKPSIS